MAWWRGREGDPSPDAWREHERRAGRFVAELDSRPLNSYVIDRAVSAAGRAWLERLWSLPEDVAGSALLLMVRRCRDRELPFPV